MINACVEIKTSCNKCGQPLPVNALVEKVICAACQTETDFPYKFWNENLLGDAFEKIGDFKDGEGQPSTIFNSMGTFSLMYGRQNPRCGKCKTPLDLNKLEEYAKAGKSVCIKCQNEVSVRILPKEAQDTLIKIKYVIGEDKDLFSNRSGIQAALPNVSRPVIYTCPSCAGALEIDGTERMIKCKYCNSEIYLPDDLWLRLHPVKTMQRWYICFDEKKINDGLIEWYNLPDVTIDKTGNLFMATVDDSSGGNDEFKVWSFGTDMKTRWVRTGLSYNEDSTGITMTNDGNLYLWDKFKHSLLKLSSKEGSTLNTLKGNSPTKENPYSFNMMGCGSLVSDSDGTIMALINNEIVRYNSQGIRVSLWGDIREEAKGHGIITGMFNVLSGGSIFHVVPEKDAEWAPCVNELHSHPARCDSDLTKINLGWDGYIYFSDRSNPGNVAKYARSGKLLWKIELPISAESKACTDSKGNVFVLGSKQDDESNTNLIRISPDGKQVEVVIKDLLEGGDLEDEDKLAVAYDGTIYIFNYYNRLKVFTSDFKKIYTSKQSGEDDEEALENYKKKIEKSS